jgi:hypothetical protein
MPDIEGVRAAIDQMTPDLRTDMPTTATEYGNRLFGIYMCGIANFLMDDDMPWADFAEHPGARHAMAQAMRLDGMRVYHGLHT